MKSSRRTFLTNGALLTAGAAVAGREVLAQGDLPVTPNDSNGFSLPMPNSTRRGDMLFRPLGRTGELVSIIGLGGYHIGKPKEESESIRLIRAAIDRGVTFMDNCWDYHKGASELRMGKALQNGYRDKVFLMSKIDGRTRQSAARQIDESLARLKTDRVDLMQFHEIIRLEDPDRIFAKGGAMEAMSDAVKAGKVRYIGFTGHKDPIVHARMLDIARENGVQFHAIQMPINVMDPHFRSFERQILPRLVQAGIGTLAMKTFGDPFILRQVMEQNIATPTQLLHYSMSKPVATVVTGIENMERLEQAVNAARTFEPMSAAQQVALLNRTRETGLTGNYEKFKTTPRFDGTAKNPDWLGGLSAGEQDGASEGE